MADPREAILARLVVVLGGIAGANEVSRNVLLDDDAEGTPKRITVLEGDEIASEDDPGNRPPISPRIVRMQPQILLSNFASSADVGSGLSSMRAAIVKAIALDGPLTALTHKNVGGRYLGMESDLAFARAMAGQMALKFQFTYVLRPDHL